tara:strand:+ start:224512 stop:225999 length:1488 start_codon:yes stop_codon:yes gene_type:complete
MAVSGNEKLSPWIWVALSVLILLALAVIFVLPRVVEQYELPLVKRVEQPPAVPVSAQPVSQGPAISPFEEAQLARQRREAQDVLASLLRQQAELEQVSVQDWAADTFASALEAARRGDEFYRSGDFAQAMLAYQEGDLVLGELLEQKPAVFEQLLSEGNTALETLDADTAAARFELAARIDPTSNEADQGLRRAQVLEEVERLLAEGSRLQEMGELQAARAQFEQASQLDPLHDRANQLLADNSQRMTDAEFNRIMSEGFALLDRGDAEQAITSFERALQVKPGSAQATEAITQTREQLTLDAIARLRTEGQAFEAAEQWQSAISTYEAALARDSNLVFAQEGKDYSERRLQLDTLLQSNLDNPIRLADRDAYDEALEVFRIGRELAADLQQESGKVGERLSAQLEQTETLLQTMQVPMEVRLVSDNATQVTIYRVGELGTFTETSVLLTPGRYVAVGTRPGYRDVREEFLVGFGSETDLLTIRCNEQVAAVNRR